MKMKVTHPNERNQSGKKPGVLETFESIYISCTSSLYRNVWTAKSTIAATSDMPGFPDSDILLWFPNHWKAYSRK